MRKIGVWLLAISLTLLAFSGSQVWPQAWPPAQRVQASKTKETLVDLQYNTLLGPCSSPVVNGQGNHLPGGPLHPPAYNRRGPHIMLAAYYVPPLMSPASQQWSFFQAVANRLGVEQVPYDGNMVVSPWPALTHKDWVVTGVPLTPLENPKPLKFSQVCQ